MPDYGPLMPSAEMGGVCPQRLFDLHTPPPFADSIYTDEASSVGTVSAAEGDAEGDVFMGAEGDGEALLGDAAAGEAPPGEVGVDMGCVEETYSMLSSSGSSTVEEADSWELVNASENCEIE